MGEKSHHSAKSPSVGLGRLPQPTLCITEKWVRERLNLQLDSLGKTGQVSPPAGIIHSCLQPLHSKPI